LGANVQGPHFGRDDECGKDARGRGHRGAVVEEERELGVVLGLCPDAEGGVGLEGAGGALAKAGAACDFDGKGRGGGRRGSLLAGSEDGKQQDPSQGARHDAKQEPTLIERRPWHGVAVLEAGRDDVAPPWVRMCTGQSGLPSVTVTETVSVRETVRRLTKYARSPRTCRHACFETAIFR
jgi:hypothetical protein